MSTPGLVYHPDDYYAESVPQGRNEWVNHPDTDPRMPGLFAARATILPGQGHGFHRHPGREEIIYVLEGAIAQWVDQERYVLRAGDSVCVPADVVHASFNAGPAPAVLFVVLSGAISSEPLAIDMAGEEPWSLLPTP